MIELCKVNCVYVLCNGRIHLQGHHDQMYLYNHVMFALIGKTTLSMSLADGRRQPQGKVIAKLLFDQLLYPDSESIQNV